MLNNAKENTKIYRQVFGCYPDNEMPNTEALHEIEKKADTSLYGLMKESIKGFAVEFPYNFLKEEDLDFHSHHVEALLPNSMWV